MEHTGPIPAVGDVGDVAGFRLVRRIGTGSRSEVYLGRATAATGPTTTAALKLFRQDADGRAIDRQVRALLAVPPLTLVRLTDVATTPDGRACLVLERLAGMSLAGLLAERGRIGPGEVVTIVATVTTALNALHEAGFSHPMVTPACVRFDATGRPVLLGLGALEVLPAGAGGTARRRDDLVRLAGFARSVIDHLDHHAPESGSTDAVLAEFEAAATMRPLPADLTDLEATLFTWAPATAVRGAVSGAGTEPVEEVKLEIAVAGSVTGRRPVAPRIGTDVTRSRREALRAPATGLAALTATGPDSIVSRLRRSALDWWNEQRDRVRPLVASRAGRSGPGTGAARRGRFPGKPVAVALSLSILLVAGALLLSAETDGAVQRSTADPEAPSPHAESGESVPTAAASLQADDPAAAVLDLLRMRQACLAAASVVCLDGVDQAGSVAMAADSYRVRQAQAADEALDPTPEPSLAALAATVQERTGNAALVVLAAAGAQVPPNTQPASALVIKGEAGWRLRELFDY